MAIVIPGSKGLSSLLQEALRHHILAPSVYPEVSMTILMIFGGYLRTYPTGQPDLAKLFPNLTQNLWAPKTQEVNSWEHLVFCLN
jgi:hypothetical protein